MIKIEYGTNNKDEKGKITLETETENPELLKKEIDTIKELYYYMRSGQELQKSKDLINKITNEDKRP